MFMPRAFGTAWRRGTERAHPAGGAAAEGGSGGGGRGGGSVLLQGCFMPLARNRTPIVVIFLFSRVSLV